ncbi:MAG: glycosyl transferase family 1 [Pirellula sp.]|nr:glycosyl transferase family 1 [Pirellula sp.]
MSLTALLAKPFRRRRTLPPLEDRGPLKVMFVITSMPVGGAETLLVNLVRRMDRERFQPELCCLKEFGPLGEVLAKEIPACEKQINYKLDWRVIGRLAKRMYERQIDAVVTVGTGGDKMFWGRLAAWRAGVPVILSALHSTGLPDRVEFSNRLLEPLTDGFIGCARPHGEYLARHEGCPKHKVFVIPNGVDVDRFRPCEPDPQLAASIGLPAGAPCAAIVAALRPEKNHGLFLNAAALASQQVPESRFLVIGDGALRPQLEQQARDLGIADRVLFLGTRSDIPQLLALTRALALSSHMEANPVSILEGLACGKPVVATRVGSIPETVHDGVSGYLTLPGEVGEMADGLTELLKNPELSEAMGTAGRNHVVENWSLARMVSGYQDLIQTTYLSKPSFTKTYVSRLAHPRSKELLKLRG